VSVLRHHLTHDGQHYGYSFHCPGCSDDHVITTKPYPRGWDFDGNEAAPTFSPSILVYPGRDMKDGVAVETPRCHSFVRAGRIEYLSDCTHALAGQTVALPELTPATEVA
jgi:hypothetical protein